MSNKIVVNIGSELKIFEKGKRYFVAFHAMDMYEREGFGDVVMIAPENLTLQEFKKALIDLTEVSDIAILNFFEIKEV